MMSKCNHRQGLDEDALCYECRERGEDIISHEQDRNTKLEASISTTKTLIENNGNMVDIRLRQHLLRVLDGDFSQLKKKATSKQTRTKIPEGVTRVRNVVTGETKEIL